MLDMNYRITTKRNGITIVDTDQTLPNAKFLPLDSISVEASIQNLADFATIILAGFVMNECINLERFFKVGDEIKIEFGYDKTLVNEFEGFIDKATYKGNDFIINCIDALYLYKVPVKSKEFKNISVKKLFEYVSSEVNSEFKVICDIEMNYDKFVIYEATGFDVLKKVAEETKFNIYFDTQKKELHIHPPFIEKTGEVIYDFSKNVEEFDLTYISTDDKKLKVIVEATDINGKQFKFEKGQAQDNSNIIKLQLSSVSKEQAEKLLETTYKNNFRDRYDGTITTWLVPFCRPGHTAKIIDNDFPQNRSKYYVEAVTTEFSENGGKRIVRLGFKVG